MELVSVDSVESTEQPPDSQPPAPTGAGLAQPRRRLLKRPWTSDWVFWLTIITTVIAGVSGAYQQAQRFSGISGLLAAASSAVVDTAVFAIIGALLLGVIPALLRWAFTLPTYRRSLTQHPLDTTAGWKQDPLNATRQRWWTGDTWAAATHPPQPSRIGNTSGWLIVAAFTILFIALFAGRASTPSATLTPTQIADTNTSTPADPSDLPVAGVVAFHYSEIERALRTVSGIPESEAGSKESFELEQEMLAQMRENYGPLKTALDQVKTQQDLGNLAPDLNALRDFVDAFEPYLAIQQAYYFDLEKCGPIASIEEWGPCEAQVFITWTEPISNSAQTVTDAYAAINASLPVTPRSN